MWGNMKNKIIEELSTGILVIDENQKIHYMNKFMKSFFKKPHFLEEYKGKNCKEILGCTSDECPSCVLHREIRKALKTKEGISENKVFKAQGERTEKINFRIKSKILKKDSLEENRLVMIEIQEAEIQKKLEKELKVNEFENEKLKTILDSLEDSVFYQDKDMKYRYVNKAFQRSVGKNEKEIIGKTDFELVPYELAKLCYENSVRALKEGDFSKEEHAVGKWYHILKGKVKISETEPGVFGIVKDITKLKLQNQLHKEQLYKDSLTGLLNRNFYEDELEKIYIETEKKKKDFTMLILDIDDFKEINDNYGHQTGDLFIQKISEIVRNNIRKDDYAVRVGGDELVVVIFENISVGEYIGRRIIEEIEEIEIEGIKSGVSIGISDKKYPKEELKNIFRRADEALYQSKKYNKGTLTVI